MRIKNLIKWDIRFQIKYGFYFIYSVLTVLYIFIIFAFPQDWREKVVTIMVFSDPAAMGLFFMGAIVLLEKSQKVINALAVSPVKVTEYILSKVISLAFISVIVAFVLALVAKTDNMILLLVGTALTSAIFTLLGLIATTKIESLNQFVLVIVPIEIVCIGPAIFYLFGYSPYILRWYPINICIGLIANKTDNMILSLLFIIITILVLFLIVYHEVVKMFQRVGGVKL